MRWYAVWTEWVTPQGQHISWQGVGWLWSDGKVVGPEGRTIGGGALMDGTEFMEHLVLIPR